MSASGKIQPKRLVNISADTMGRVTNLAVEEGQRVKKGQFLLQIDPRNLSSAVRPDPGVARGRASADGTAPGRVESAKAGLKQAQDAYARQQQLWKGGLTTKRRSTTRGQPAEDAAGGVELRLGTGRDAASADDAGTGVARERQIQPEQGPHRVADQRHHHPPQHRRGRDRRDRHDEQRGHGPADGRRHVRHPRRSRGRRDRHPDRDAGPAGEGDHRCACRARRSAER